MDADRSKTQPSCGAASTWGASTARRLLNGAGRLTVAPYANPELAGTQVLTHRWSPEQRQLLLACVFPDAPPVGTIDVRLQLDKAAALAEVSILAATGHALSGLSVLSPEEVRSEPGLSAEWASEEGSGGMVWCAASPKLLLLHVAGRVEHHRVGDVMAAVAFPLGLDELSATEIVRAYGDIALARLAADVVDGRRPGESVQISVDEPSCAHLRERIFPVDVCEHGVAFMITGRAGAGLVQVAFDRAVHSLADFARAFDDLFVGEPAAPAHR